MDLDNKFSKKFKIRCSGLNQKLNLTLNSVCVWVFDKTFMNLMDRYSLNAQNILLYIRLCVDLYISGLWETYKKNILFNYNSSKMIILSVRCNNFQGWRMNLTFIQKLSGNAHKNFCYVNSHQEKQFVREDE